jgi:hypothetical protein
MAMTASMDAVDYICNIRLPTHSLWALNCYWKSRLLQVDAWTSHWPENAIVVAQKACKACIAADLRIELSSRTIYGIAGVKHGGLRFTLRPVVYGFAY